MFAFARKKREGSGTSFKALHFYCIESFYVLLCMCCLYALEDALLSRSRFVCTSFAFLCSDIVLSEV